MSDETLVEYQTKAYNEVVGEYIFECTGGGAEPIRSATKKALKKGIKLHFFRYGLFEKTSDTDNGTTFATISEGKKKFKTHELEVSQDQIPSTNQFYLTRTFLREGYLYLINKSNKNKYREYEVNALGELKSIVWTKGNDGDRREASGKPIRFVTVDTAGEYYIGFSPVQWGRAYFDTLNADDAKKSELMHTIDCSGIAIGSSPSSDEIVAYKDIKVACEATHPYKEQFRAKLKEIHADENQQTEKGGNEWYEDMFITLNDPVGCAEDIAEVLGDKVLDFKALTEAIQSGESEEDAKKRIIAGSAPAAIEADYADLFNLALACYKMVYNDKESVKEYDGGAPGDNWRDTHFKGQSPGVKYGTVRGTRIRRPPGWQPSELYIGNGLDREKVEGILGVKERKNYRDIVNVYREELGNFIQQAYFNTALHHYTQNEDVYGVFGHEKIYLLLLLLSNNPYDIDRHLSLEGDQVGPGFEKYVATDAWSEWVAELVNQTEVNNAEDHLQKLVVEHKTIAQTSLEAWIDLSNKYGAALAAKLEIYAKIDKTFAAKIVLSATGQPLYQKTLKQRSQHIIDKLNKIEIISKQSGKAEKPFHFGNANNIKMKAHLLGAKSDPNIDYVVKNGKQILYEGKAESFSHRMLYGKEAIAKDGKHVIEIGEEVKNINQIDYEVNQTTIKRYNEKAAKFLNSRGFAGVLFGLQTLNLGKAILDTHDTFKRTDANNYDKFKVVVNSTGIAGEFTEAMLKLREAHLKSFGLKLGTRAANTLYAAGAIGGAITSGMCFWDASIAFGKHDQDKAVALTFAGVAFGVATGVGLITGSTVVAGAVAGALTASGIAISGSALALLLGPVGWIALGAGLVFIVLANYFQDSELEFYFKNFLLSDQEALPLGDLRPMEYTRWVLDKKEELMQKADDDAKAYLTHPSDAMASLYDITVCNAISYKVPRDGFSKKIGGGRSAQYRVYKFAVAMVFHQFLRSGDQLEALGIFHDATNDDTTPFPLTTKATVVSKKQDNGTTLYELQATLGIPSDKIQYIGNRTKLVVALRLRLNGASTGYFPYPLVQKKERWIGARFGLTKGIMGKNSTSDQEVLFDSITELRSTTLW